MAYFRAFGPQDLNICLFLSSLQTQAMALPYYMDIQLFGLDPGLSLSLYSLDSHTSSGLPMTYRYIHEDLS